MNLPGTVNWFENALTFGLELVHFWPAALMLLTLLIPSYEGARRDLAEAGSTRRGQPCRRLVLTGEVAAGGQWSAAIGEGWLFRLAPIAPSDRGYSGWDLIVNRVGDESYPDALLLATPPYGSLNEREIGTTYGLRAQDAIAWGPRRFRFLTTTKQLARARELYLHVMPIAGSGVGTPAANPSQDQVARGKAATELLAIVSSTSALGSGQFEVLDSRLMAGVANPPAFAEQWAAHLIQVPHSIVQTSGSQSSRGVVLWIRFKVTFLLPKKWNLPADLHGEAAKCAE